MMLMRALGCTGREHFPIRDLVPHKSNRHLSLSSNFRIRWEGLGLRCCGCRMRCMVPGFHSDPFHQLFPSGADWLSNIVLLKHGKYVDDTPELELTRAGDTLDSH
jgi:hypothetical protein